MSPMNGRYWPVADTDANVIRLPVPSTAFQPFPVDTHRVERRLRHVDAGDRHGVVDQLVAQAIEELGRTHLSLCIAPGPDCDECWWLSKAIAAHRAGGHR